ncbi:MAG: hypothetical protein ACE5R6_12345 [Candidatus Heimdallarchaeota archaeon]
MKPLKKISLFVLILSVLLLLSGVIALGYTYLLFPTLIPSYVGGEPFYLDASNNYSTQFPWSANSRLHITIKANDTVDVYTDGSYVYSGTYYELTIEPNVVVMIMLKSSSSVSGRFTARQEIPRKMQVVAFGLLFLGLVATTLSVAFHVWLQR